MNLRTIPLILLRCYWRLLKPSSFGVKAAILHPNRKGEVLLVQHSYGSRNTWNLPGGGYKPQKETAEAAMRRELKEELGVVCERLQRLGDYFTDAEGKKDTVTIFACLPHSLDFALGRELREIKWVRADEIVSDRSYYRVVRRGAELVINARLATVYDG